MRTYRIERFGTTDGLASGDTAEPTAGPGQILVDMRAWSLNYRDLMVLRGQYGGDLQPGLVPLSDGAGTVVAVGDGVTRFKPGDRVAGCFFDDWQDGVLTQRAARTARGAGFPGVLAERVAMGENGAVSIPDGFTFAEAATLPCASLTDWHALVPFGAVLPGQTVVTLGTGGVSVFAIQFARALGARVIATSSSEAKCARARALGADDTIDYRAHEDWDAEVKRLTGQVGADLVIEVGGAGTFPRSMAATVPGGRVAVIGLLSGLEGRIDPLTILRRRLRVEGILVGSTAMFEAMNRAIARWNVRPVIDRVFPFDDARGAYVHLDAARHFGKVVISRE